MKNFWCALLAIILFSFLSPAQEQWNKKYQGLLWEITGNGLTKPSYLYGTMHVSRKSAFHLSDTFFIALNRANIIALEFDMLYWMHENAELDLAKYQKEYVENYSTPSGFYKKAFSISEISNNELKKMLKASPSVIDHMLYRSSASKSDFEEDTYLDHFIFQAGYKLKKQVVGLENFKVFREMLSKAAEPDINIDEDAEKEERERSRLILKEFSKNSTESDLFEESYRKGDLDMLDSLTKLNNRSRNYRKYVLYDRNAIMAQGMDSIMKTGNSLFTGVGAAHLPGELGIIELLRKQGYKLRPVVYTDLNENKMKNTIDEMRVPVKFIKEYSSDSAFSVDVPDKLFKISSGSYWSDYLCLDIPNGSYYYIQRSNHFAGIKGNNHEYIMKKVDSMLYENIPGKILSKKLITKNGHRGYDILSKTSKGDIHRYNIIVTPQELLIFKMGARENYVSAGKEADMFFNSIVINNKSTNVPHKWENPYIGVAVTFPGQYLYHHKSYQAAGQQNTVTHLDSATGSHYFFVHASLHDFNYLEEDTFELNILSEIFAIQQNCKIINRVHSLWNGYPTLETEYNTNGKTYYTKTVIKGVNYFMAGCRSSQENAKKFIESLTITTPTLSPAFSEYTDTNLLFKVQTTLNPSKYSGIVRNEYSSYYYRPKSKKKQEEDLFLPEQKKRYYMCSETGEYVYVGYRKFSMYYQELNMDSYWDERVYDLTNETGLVWKEKEKKKTDVAAYLEGELYDTNSTRKIIVKMIQKCGVLYTLKANIDSVQGPGSFISTFFSSFSPKDTCIGAEVTSDKLGVHFFDKIYSADTTIRKRTENAIPYVTNNLSDTHTSSMIKLIENPEFEKLPSSDKKNLIEGFGKLHSPEVLPFLTKLYSKYNDSLDLQFAVLAAIARQKTEKSAETFLRLFNEDLPVTSNESDISNCFNYFSDSLEYAKNLFPAILNYTRFPEYQSEIYHLLATLVQKEKIKAKAYSSYRSSILSDAGYALKLYLSTESSSSSDNYLSDYSYTRKARKKFVPEDNFTNYQETIYNYVILLSPFAANKQVKSFFEKIMKSKDDYFKICMMAYMLDKNIPVNDTLWTHYAKKESTRIDLYSVLSYYNRLDKMPENYLVQEELAKEQIRNHKDLTDKGDTIVLLNKVYMNIKNNNGYVYLFKWKPQDKKIWKLAYTGLHPDDTKKINIQPEALQRQISFESEQQLKKEMETAINKLRISERKRASYSDFEKETGSSYSYFGDY